MALSLVSSLRMCARPWLLSPMQGARPLSFSRPWDERGERHEWRGGEGERRGRGGGGGGFRGRKSFDRRGGGEGGGGGRGRGRGRGFGFGGGGGGGGGGFRSDRRGGSPFRGEVDNSPLVELTPPVSNSSFDFYVEGQETSAHTLQEVENFRKEHSMMVTGENIPNPILSFSEMPFSPKFTQLIASKGFRTPTPIQGQSWPILMQGRDLVGQSWTGSGKTLAFMLPAIHHVSQHQQKGSPPGPKVLIVVPTRELAAQVHSSSVPYASVSGVRAAALYGGSNINSNRHILRREEPGIIIGTPGRLLALCNSRDLDLSRVSYLVFDEADYIMDVGWERDLRKLMAHATFPDSVVNLKSFIKPEAVHVMVKGSELATQDHIDQQLVFTTGMEKMNSLMELLKENNGKRVLIFAEQRSTVKNVERGLQRSGFAADSIHGDKTQNDRERSLRRFRSSDDGVLVATNVASRGLDVHGVDLVINYDLPNTIESYVHRVGRTGRAGAAGASVSLVDPDRDHSLAKDLMKTLQASSQDVPQELSALVSAGSPRSRNSRNNRGSGGRGGGGGGMRRGGGNRFGGGGGRLVGGFHDRRASRGGGGFRDRGSSKFQDRRSDDGFGGGGGEGGEFRSRFGRPYSSPRQENAGEWEEGGHRAFQRAGGFRD